MHKITRIYVGNCGTRMSWYDGLLLDCRSVESGLPVDTILHLENGGGKTVLLSLIFSCFETRADRFLKHLHESKNRISQYFADDGTPGIIAVEWLRDDGTERESTIVTGQVAANKAIPGSEELERYFFSFIAQDDLTLESLPGPKLANAASRSMTETLRWFEQQKSKKRGLFYSTRLQNDWERHLETERGIDVGLLKLQLEFSRAEGGVDSGFMTFKTEFDFLKLFFELTLDQERIRNVRDAIGITCDKLRRKPEFEARVRGLGALLDGAREFAQNTADYETCQSELKQLHYQAGCAVNSFTKQAAGLSQMVSDSAEKINNLTVEIDQKGALLKKTNILHRLLLLLKLVKEEEDVTQQLSQLERKNSDAEDELRRLKAANSFKDVLSIEETLLALQKQREEIEAGLDDLKEPLKKQGTNLVERYRNIEDAGQTKLSHLELFQKKSKQAEEDYKRVLNELQKQESLLTKEHGEFTTRVKQYREDLSQLMQDRIIDQGEAPQSCIERWSARLNEINNDFAELELKIETTDCLSRDLLDKLRQDEKAQMTGQAERDSVQNILAEAENERNRLLRLGSIESAAADRENIVLDEELVSELETLKREIAGKQSVNEVSLAQLVVDRQSIESVGLTQSCRDVNVVVTALQSIGIKTAKSFASYLAKVKPEKEAAKRLILTDPARYLGVCVQTETELTECGKIKDFDLDIRTPIMISVVADKATPVDYALVIPARRNSDFNFEAARELEAELSELESEQRLLLVTWQINLKTVCWRLRAYKTIWKNIRRRF